MLVERTLSRERGRETHVTTAASSHDDLTAVAVIKKASGERREPENGDDDLVVWPHANEKIRKEAKEGRWHGNDSLIWPRHSVSARILLRTPRDEAEAGGL